ncbi:hypothetical protein [Methylocystis hirsuta]|nr:hypothetical protein [Methylocystis hirsuta]
MSGLLISTELSNATAVCRSQLNGHGRLTPQLLSGLHLMAFSSRLSFELSRVAQAFESHFRYAGASRRLRERRLRRPSARVKSSKRLEKQIRKLDGNKTAREFLVGIGLLTVFVFWINGIRP